jgi:hypothetical protein
MKYTLTVATDDPAEIAAYLNNILDGETVTLAMPAPAPQQSVQANDNAPQPMAQQPVGDLDSRGYPWDGRIHAGSRAKNANGTWRYKRNTPEDQIKAVEAEIKPQPSAPAMPAVPTSDAGDDPLAIPAFAQRNPDGTFVNPPVAVPNGAPPASAPTIITYETIVGMMTDKLKAGALTPLHIPTFFQECGVANVEELRVDQNAIDAAYAKLALL